MYMMPHICTWNQGSLVTQGKDLPENGPRLFFIIQWKHYSPFPLATKLFIINHLAQWEAFLSYINVPTLQQKFVKEQNLQNRIVPYLLKWLILLLYNSRPNLVIKQRMLSFINGQVILNWNPTEEDRMFNQTRENSLLIASPSCVYSKHYYILACWEQLSWLNDSQ